ncbi:hypothetical protein Ga0100231_003555 [Opitutaceae bacterium TAV4]|nr:hypothetical protein Ga0100231_003555 [Opitutaceae bacterium TAV4]
MPGNESIQSVQRAVKVLYAVAGVDGGCSVAQIAAKAGLKLHTAYKFTQTLEREHLLTRKTNPLRFVLGPALNELKTLDDERQLLTVSSKILVRTHARLPQSNLMLLEQSGTTTYQRLCIQINRPGVVIQRREYLVPLYSKASSLLFLAYSTPEEAQKIYAMNPFEPNGKLVWGTQSRLEECLAKTRRLGYCLPDVPDIEGPMFRVAAPVFSPGNEVIAAVGGVLLLDEPAKFQPTLVRLCREAAKEITGSLRERGDED